MHLSLQPHLHPGSLSCCPFQGGGSVVVDLLLYVHQLFVGVLFWSTFWYALLYILSSFAILLSKKKGLVVLFLLSFGCLVTVNVL